MKKNELVGLVSKKCGIAKKDCMLVLDSVLDTITETLATGEDVMLFGFGKFEVRERAARTGRNPQTGAEMKIDAAKVPAFKAGKALKDLINK